MAKYPDPGPFIPQNQVVKKKPKKNIHEAIVNREQAEKRARKAITPPGEHEIRIKRDIQSQHFITPDTNHEVCWRFQGMSFRSNSRSSGEITFGLSASIAF